VVYENSQCSIFQAVFEEIKGEKIDYRLKYRLYKKELEYRQRNSKKIKYFPKKPDSESLF
jgi:hypothetical protein